MASSWLILLLVLTGIVSSKQSLLGIGVLLAETAASDEGVDVVHGLSGGDPLRRAMSPHLQHYPHGWGDESGGHRPRWLQDASTPSPVPMLNPVHDRSDDETAASGDDDEARVSQSTDEIATSAYTPTPSSTSAETVSADEPMAYSSSAVGGASSTNGPYSPMNSEGITAQPTTEVGTGGGDEDGAALLTPSPASRPSRAPMSNMKNTPTPTDWGVPTTTAPAPGNDNDDWASGRLVPTAGPVSTVPDSDASLEAPPTPFADEATRAPTHAAEDEATPMPTPASGETPAPTMEGAVSQLSGSVTAPTSALNLPASAKILEDELRDLMNLDDQDSLEVVIAVSTSSRRRLGLAGSGKGEIRGFAREGAEVDYLLSNPGDGGLADTRDRRRRVISVDGYEGFRDGEAGLSGHRRVLADKTTAHFVVIFINDAQESAAYGRGADAAVKLLDGREEIAAALGTSEGDVSITDVVYSSTTASDIDTADAASTFFDGNGSASGNSIAIAVAFILAAGCATGCIGATVGKCWLRKERRCRGDHKEKCISQAAYERPYRTSGDSDVIEGPGGRGRVPFIGGTPGSASQSAQTNAFGRLAPSVSTGGLLLLDNADVSASGKNLAMHSHEDGPHSCGGSCPGLQRVGRSSATGADEEGGGNVMEHVYGDPGQTESFVDGVDGTYSEFGGQSEYDPVVPGGSANDGLLSDGDSSSRCFDDDGHSEWGTDVSNQEHGAMGGFPLRKASSRFSTGPRSQASFATPSIAASGRSIQSSVLPSRAHFKPASGGELSPPHGCSNGGEVGVGGPLGPGLGRGEEEGAETFSVCGRVAGVSNGQGIQQQAKLDPEEGRQDVGKGDPGISPFPEEVKKNGTKGNEGKESVRGRPCFSTFAAVTAAEAATVASTAAVSTASLSSAAPGGHKVAFENGVGALGPEIAGRPSLDSAAGSVAISSVVPQNSDFSQPGSIVAVRGVGGGTGLGEVSELLYSAGIGDGGGGVVSNGGRGSVPGIHDDDATSQYVRSPVVAGGGKRIMHGPGSSGGGQGHSIGDGAGTTVRPLRIGGLAGAPTGRNSQSIGDMTRAESSTHDSDRESFVSRVGSYALTDIGIGPSEREQAGSFGRVVGEARAYSPTSTILRSTTGLSELASERDSCGSDGYTNGSDSPGAQSGWERAWMRQRNDSSNFGGQSGGH